MIILNPRNKNHFQTIFSRSVLLTFTQARFQKNYELQKQKNRVSKKQSLKRSFMMFTWLSLLGVGLWALMYYSAPESNLEPYKNIQEAKIKPERKAPEPEQKEPAFTLPSDLDTGKLIKTATSVPAAQSRMPRETLEHIQKGMLFTEEGQVQCRGYGV